MIHAKEGHLRKAFSTHSLPTEQANESRMLLLFYAVECGLKSAWLRQNRLSDTSQLGPEFDGKGHDLAFWVKQLRLPASVANGVRDFRLRGTQQRHRLSQAHEAWRYGVAIQDDDEKSMNKWLEQVCNWIRKELQV
ncbi:MAG: hypothetical protein U0R19_35305 [Bryobacteraceae bacterium]